MASFLKSIFGSDEPPENLQKLVEKGQRERKALGEAVKKTVAAAQNFEKITAPLEETKAAMADLKGRLSQCSKATR